MLVNGKLVTHVKLTEPIEGLTMVRTYILGSNHPIDTAYADHEALEMEKTIKIAMESGITFRLK